MKKFIINILVFVVIVVFLDVAFGRLCRYLLINTKSGETVRIANVFLKNNYDIMVMGSSRCVCHYDDKLIQDSLSVETINAGYKGNGIILMYGRYHMIDRDKKPRVLIYDVEPSFDILKYDDDSNRRYLSGLKMYYDMPGVPEIFESVDWREPIKMICQMYRYNSEFFTLCQNYIRTGNGNNSFYLPSYRQYTNLEDKKISLNSPIDSTKFFYLEKLMTETKTDGVQLIVVASPKYGVSSTDNLKIVEELCANHDIPFWNYYDDMHETRWFCDNMHLNIDGSQEFTKNIIHRIQKEIKIQ